MIIVGISKYRKIFIVDKNLPIFVAIARLDAPAIWVKERWSQCAENGSVR